jgi:hypothetical protein
VVPPHSTGRDHGMAWGSTPILCLEKAMPHQSQKAREDRCRRALLRLGLALHKSRRRDPAMYDHGGYMIVDLVSDASVAGSSPIPYAMSLADVEAHLADAISAETIEAS